MDGITKINPDKDECQEFLGIKRKYWFIGIGGILILCLVIALFLNTSFSGLTDEDPIPGMTPKDSVLSVSIDFTKALSGDIEGITRILLQMSIVDPTQPMMETLDQYMQKEIGMTLTDDVLPWIGRYAGLIVHNIDPNEISESDAVFVLSARNISKANKFLKQFVNYLEDSSGNQYDSTKIDGVTYYSSTAPYEETTICRSGNFIFLGTSLQSIEKIININKTESLSTLDTYKMISSELPGNSLGELFLNLGNKKMITDLILKEMDLPIYLSPAIANLINPEMTGISFSVTDDGLQFETASTITPDNLTEFEKVSLNVSYQESDIDQLMPYDSFFYISTNSSLEPERYFSNDGPMKNPDVAESLKLFESENGIDVEQIANLLTGEFGLSYSPANDGLFTKLEGTNIGMTLIAGTNDESSLNTQINKSIDSIIGNFLNLDFGLGFFINLLTQEVSYGDFDLQAFVLGLFFSTDPMYVFGADNGYYFYGTSPVNLSESLGGGQNLADNDKYQNSWKAFPASSTPFLYIDMVGLVKYISQSDPDAFRDKCSDIPEIIDRIPVFAVVRHDPSNNFSRSTGILFLNTDH